MKEKTERWMELCKLVAKEQDPEKMLELIEELNELLEAKQQRLGIKPIVFSKSAN